LKGKTILKKIVEPDSTNLTEGLCPQTGDMSVGVGRESIISQMTSGQASSGEVVD